MQPFQIYATGEYPSWDETGYTVVKSMVVKLYGHTINIGRQESDLSFEVKVSKTAIGI